MKKYQIDKYNIVNISINTSIKLTTLREYMKIMNIEEYRLIIRALNYTTILTRFDIIITIRIVIKYIQKLERLY